MVILIKTAQFLLSISILVIIHELGHYMFAKLFKTRVEKFYLFFDPWFSLFKYKKGDTEYGVGWLPLGGYVKISGMIDESMDKEQMKQPPQPYEFRSKTTWQRLLIMIGGVTMNFLLAFFVYAMILFTWGEKYLPNNNVTNGIMVDSLAYDLGFRNGDKILLLDGDSIENFNHIPSNIILNETKQVTILRNDSILNIAISDTAIKYLIKNPLIFDPRMPFVIAKIAKDSASAAKDAGMMAGDQIVAFNSHPLQFYDQVRDSLVISKSKDVIITVLREGKTVELKTHIPASGLLGVYVESSYEKYFTLKTVEYGFFESFPAGISKSFRTTRDYLKQFKLLFNKETEAYKEIGGFMKIGSFFPSEWNWQAFWTMTAFLSIILAVLNILPIPALDGGHVLFLMYEIVTGRKPGDKFLEYAQIVGMVLLFALLIYANGNDIINIFFK